MSGGSRPCAWLPLLVWAAVFLGSCQHDEPHDIVIDRLRIASLATGEEIAQPAPRQHVGLEMLVKAPGVTDMIRFVFTMDDSVMADVLERESGGDTYARSGFEIVIPDHGTHTYRVVADPEDLISEDHEDNNEAVHSVTVPD